MRRIALMAKIAVVGSYPRSLVDFRGPLLRRMKELGHEPVACGPPGDDLAVQTLASWGVRFHPIRIDRTGLNPARDALALIDLIGMSRKEHPEAMLLYTIKPILYGSLAARIAGVERTYSMITGLGFAFTGTSVHRRWIARMLSALYRHALAHSECVLFQNADDQEEFLRFGIIEPSQRVAFVNGSGVDLDHYVERPLPVKPIFLLIARLLGDKGIREYVAAARVVRQRYPSAIFRLVGWFDDNPAALSRRVVDEWVGEGIVEYRGAVDDVRQDLSECRIYVLPSYREGTPRTILEAMAVGRPVITTDVPGCRETVKDGDNGLIVPARDPAALAEAMIELLERPELVERMARRSLEIVRSRFDSRIVNEQILSAMRLIA